MDSLFLQACRREKTARTPIWLMRQAGRYMKEYRDLRARVPFIELCKTPDLAAQVTVEAAHILNVDAAIIFSDILLILEPLGFKLTYEKNEGPQIHNPFRGSSDMKRVGSAEAGLSLEFVSDAIRETKQSLNRNIPLIGFAGAPFTVASYAIEGGGSRNFIRTKNLMLSDPALWKRFMTRITDATVAYVNTQIDAGADAIQFFDSWVGCLSPHDFSQFVLPYVKTLVKQVKKRVPVIYFGTQTTSLLPQLKETGADVIGVDWRVDLDVAWKSLGSVAIQGNLDPVTLFSNPKAIRSEVKRILAQAGGRSGHIFNLGHGILPETPVENVHALIDMVKELSAR